MSESVLTAIACTYRLSFPRLPTSLWQKILEMLGEDDYPDDPEGVFELAPREEPLPGNPGDGILHFSLCLLGSCMGTPEANYRLWSSHPTTCACLPTVIADIAQPGWRADVGRVTRLCCELSYRHTQRTLLSRQSVAFVPVTDWRGGQGRHHRRPSDMASCGAYVVYFSARCKCSLAYAEHRLGQLQVERQKDSVQVVERMRGIGYGCKEYDHSEQIRKPSFRHIPLVLAAFDSECFCGAAACGSNDSGLVSRKAGQRLAEKLKCPLIQVENSLSGKTDGMLAVFDALVAECHRIDNVTRLGTVSVPRGAQPRPELHLGDGQARGNRGICTMM